MDRYNFNIIEKKWQDFWDKNQSFKTVTDKNKKFYVLEMFPYHRKDTHGTCSKLYNWRCTC